VNLFKGGHTFRTLKKKWFFFFLNDRAIFVEYFLKHKISKQNSKNLKSYSPINTTPHRSDLERGAQMPLFALSIENAEGQVYGDLSNVIPLFEFSIFRYRIKEGIYVIIAVSVSRVSKYEQCRTIICENVMT